MSTFNFNLQLNAREIKKFTVFCEPVPKGRPRASFFGGHARLYTPKNTRKFEDYVRLVASEHRPDEPFSGAILLKLDFFLTRPKSLPKKYTQHLKKPDTDNLVKSVTDGMEKIMFLNDSQIVVSLSTKNYGTPVRIEVTVVELE